MASRMELLEEGREREERREVGDADEREQPGAGRITRNGRGKPAVVAVINDGLVRPRCPVSRVLAPRGGCVAARGTRPHLVLLLPCTASCMHRVGAARVNTQSPLAERQDSSTCLLIWRLGSRYPPPQRARRRNVCACACTQIVWLVLETRRRVHTATTSCLLPRTRLPNIPFPCLLTCQSRLSFGTLTHAACARRRSSSITLCADAFFHICARRTGYGDAAVHNCRLPNKVPSGRERASALIRRANIPASRGSAWCWCWSWSPRLVMLYCCAPCRSKSASSFFIHAIYLAPTQR